MQEPVQAVNLNTARSAKASTKEAPTDVGEIAEDSFLEESTLDATEFLAKVVPTVVGVWDLEATHTESDAPEAEFFAHTSGGDETVVGDDNRKPVSAVDFAPGGKYRCELLQLCCQRNHYSINLYSYCQTLLALC